MIGTTIGPFRVLEQVGSGGMGVVFRARDERLHRDVALKFLPPGSLASESLRRQFHREAVALSRLNHPGIATVYDFQTVDGKDFLVMEYIPGESLDQCVGRGPLPEPEVIALGLQLADGLAEAHRRGIIHRDLKPGNLRVTPEGRLKILDFGLAKWRTADSESLQTVSVADARGIAGTPAYIAPEVLRGEPASEGSDLYAAGLVLYELATGSRPFPGLATDVLFDAILNRKAPPPRSRNPHISAKLEAVILRCLESRPDLRHASANELAETLRRLDTGAIPRRRPRPARPTPAMALVVALVVAGVATASVVWWSARSTSSKQASTLRSLAVLPLGNLSGDSEQEYFADGMTEALIAQLSHVRAIRVISLTSAMRYKGTRRPMSQVARELNVDGVIEGNVLKSRDRLRITVHLIAARDDDQLWSGEYGGDTTDVLRLQSKVAQAIVREIQVRLSRTERAQLATGRAVDPAAYHLYLRGRYHWNRRPAGIRLAIDYFQRAIAQDSLYAPAHAGLADAWAAAGLYGLVPPVEARGRARSAASQAVALDPDLSEAHTSLGNVLHNFDWDWDGAEQEYLRAIALNPNNAVAHHWRAHLLAQRGRLAEAREELRDAVESDPLSLSIANAGAVLEYYARRFDAALRQCDRAMELDSMNALVHRVRAAVLDQLGRESEAVHELARSLELRGQSRAAAALVRTYDASGLSRALELLIAGLIKKRESGAYEPAEHIAELYGRIGRVDEAFHWLEIALAEHDTELNRLRVDPIFDPLRADPRFADLLHRVGLDGPAPRS